jgi:GDP-L-fucose synthase
MRLRLRDVQFYEIWGFGTPRREFLHVDDAADALVRLMTAYSSDEHIDVGSGEEVSIMELAKMIAHIVGFSGELTMDPSKPDGTPSKLLDSSKLHELGWRSRISLQDTIILIFRKRRQRT